ncbi:hypothetical protein BaRGS_00017033 [Batillaria attramentaria]|uniref:Uncharacterized protein n=1 Tax=Batillaria attramentaria TaxID=370345 RepID=A0ABD0KX22_9CAEN
MISLRSGLEIKSWWGNEGCPSGTACKRACDLKSRDISQGYREWIRQRMDTSAVSVTRLHSGHSPSENPFLLYNPQCSTQSLPSRQNESSCK